MTLSVKIDLTQAEMAYDRAAQGFVRDLKASTARAVEDGAEEAKATKRFRNRSGRLAESIRGEAVRTTTGGAVGVLEAGEEYASYVNDGTDPHVIEGNPFLTFQLPNGQWVRTRSVNHPGTEPDGFMDRGADKAKAVLEDEIERSAVRMQRELDR